MSNPHYQFAFRTYADAAVVPAGISNLYWYDSGLQVNGQSVHYDTSGTYARWSQSGPNFVYSALADVDGDPSDFFGPALEGGDFTGNGAWTGTLKESTNVISDAWYRAENEAFTSLKEFLGGTEGTECWRGEMPVQGDYDELKYVNVWAFSSGSSGTMDMERLIGNNPAWCSMRADVAVDSLWKSRKEAMEFAGAVQAWLKQTGNLNETGNVTWCSLQNIPAEPMVYRTKGANAQTYWRMELLLDLVYSTEGTY
jgi:hypothetical protein